MITTLQQLINILDQLINLTQEDIKNIKQAKHKEVFKNTKPKEELAKEFYKLKNILDKTLASRNRPLEEIFSKDEEILFEEFKHKLEEFHTLHKRFSKLALSVANFYNTLYQQIRPSKQVTYKESTYTSSLEIKG